MGLRFRKSFKLGPIRINLSKSGIGYSYGVKGFRVTHKANGGVRTTASIPGTGISYVSETSAKKSTQKLKATQHQRMERDSMAPQSTKKAGRVETIYLTDDSKPVVTPEPQFMPKATGESGERTVTITDKYGNVRHIKYIKCPKCSRDMLETSKICTFCSGTKAYSWHSYRTGNYTQKSKKTKLPLMVAALAVVVVGIGVLGGGDEEVVPVPEMSVQEALQLVEGGGANIPSVPSATPKSEGEDVVAETPGQEKVKTEVMTEAPKEKVTEPKTEPATEPKTELKTELSTEAKTETVTEPVTEQQTEATVKDERVYIGNSNTMKFHYQKCSSVEKIKPEHVVEIKGRDAAVAKGYEPCGRCDP